MLAGVKAIFKCILVSSVKLESLRVLVKALAGKDSGFPRIKIGSEAAEPVALPPLPLRGVMTSAPVFLGWLRGDRLPLAAPSCNPSPSHRSSVCNRSRAECALRERRAAGLRRACGGVRWRRGSSDAPGGPPRDVTSLLRSGRAKPERRTVTGAVRQSPPPPPRTPIRRARALAPTTYMQAHMHALMQLCTCRHAHAISNSDTII